MACDNDLERLFQKHKKDRFLAVIPGGNHGDYLIYFGFHQLAQKANIDFDEIDEQQLAQTNLDDYDVVYLHGSGGYNDWSSGAAERILQTVLKANVSLVIQGPCTVAESEIYVQGLFDRLREFSAQRFVFYSRENTSSRLVQQASKDPRIEAGLNFDTALFANKADVERSFGACKENYRLYALREDNERSTGDIHDFGPGITLDPARYCKSFAHWVKVHACAREIITTRTHSAVIGAILGKRTVLYPGSYHKNRSIWEYCLRDMGVLWGPDTVDKPARGGGPRFIPRKVRSSYKVRQAVLWANKVPLM